jgi:sortase A
VARADGVTSLAVTVAGADSKSTPARRRRTRRYRWAGALLAMLALWQLGTGLWIPAKAWLAQILIARAWEQSMATGKAAAPWPWADTAPVARLLVPRLGIDQIVLAHATGRSLAFGPGHLDGSPAPGEPGLAIVSGHRDTSFRFLADIAVGDEVRIQRADGGWTKFRVTHGAVLDERSARLPLLVNGPARLALTTCYPFDAIAPGGPLRYVAWAEAE